MGYIKGIYSSTIFNNEDNGYTVGLLKVLETDIEFVGKNITFVILCMVKLLLIISMVNNS